MIFTEVERNFYCLAPIGGGDHCARPRDHIDGCGRDLHVYDAVAFQDVREGEVLADVRERIILEVTEGRLTVEAANVVLVALDMQMIEEEER